MNIGVSTHIYTNGVRVIDVCSVDAGIVCVYVYVVCVERGTCVVCVCVSMCVYVCDVCCVMVPTHTEIHRMACGLWCVGCMYVCMYVRRVCMQFRTSSWQAEGRS